MYMVVMYFLLTLPFSFFILRMKTERGCITGFWYLIVLAVLSFVPLVGFARSPQALIMLLMAIGGYACAFCLPLMFLSESGVKLWSRYEVNASDSDLEASTQEEEINEIASASPFDD